MKAHLLYRSRDFDWKWVLQAAAKHQGVRTLRRYDPSYTYFDPKSGIRWNADTLTTDLSLDTLFKAMAHEDYCIYQASGKVLLTSENLDRDTILYRQAVLQDCLKNPSIVRQLYANSIAAIEKGRGHYLGVLARYPSYVLRRGIESIEGLLEFLKRLRTIADLHRTDFASEGWTSFFVTIQENLSDDYFIAANRHLENLKFRNGVLLSAEVGIADKGAHYLIHRVPHHKWSLHGWWEGLFAEKPPSYSFELDSRDEAGVQALNMLRDRGIALVANALGKSADHLLDFFGMLRAELAFYVGCINLHERLSNKGEPLCMPTPAAAGAPTLSFRGLYDIGLALSIDTKAIGNDGNADGKTLVIITGPNTGGKSTFLRSIGLAQLMLRAGMFVPAYSFRGSVCDSLSTHFKKEEDASMTSGKFDEELSRMSQIVDHLTPHAMLLLNESFASTNEREGSEIARQIVSSLLKKGARIFYVTHMYELARRFSEERWDNALFLRAGREADGRRTFKLDIGEPLRTSYGEDLYYVMFPSSDAKQIT